MEYTELGTEGPGCAGEEEEIWLQTPSWSWIEIGVLLLLQVENMDEFQTGNDMIQSIFF